MKITRKLLLISMILVLSLTLIVGCGGQDVTDNGNDDNNILSGSVIGGGSTSVKKIIEAAGEEFTAQNPDVVFEYNATGSSDGIKGANEGTYMFGCASRNLKEEKEKPWNLTELVFAYDGIAVIIHPSNEVVVDITIDQLSKIYKGEITNWNEVGGNDAPIVVVSREDGSGTRGAFEELVGYEGELFAKATIAEGNGNVQTTVAGNPNAIGYVSFTYVDETVKALTVDGVEATVENVLNESYGISRPFVMAYHEENMDDVSNVFVNFLMSSEGQQIVEEKHGIPVK